ncbi:MAG TPA: CPBP family intramembrane glutamic endopeptidase [Polyangiaceae bacterium]|nr:CPBP family intramembrane glutamic endopeptidase [Polyangiaceae bacterium]
MTSAAEAPARTPWKEASGPWTDLGLTLPIFVGYHLGVVVLPVRNAADLVTFELITLANNSMFAYSALTIAIAAVYVGVLWVAGRGRALRWERFLWIGIEGIVYAFTMRLIAASVVGNLGLSSVVGLARGIDSGFAGLVMSFGAGFYEEVMFRVVLFGLGARLLIYLFPIPLPAKRFLLKVAWAVITAAIFSAWHYVGPMGDDFDLVSFVFRWVCGIVFCFIYWFRGFAPAVWTHALYDVWVLVLN